MEKLTIDWIKNNNLLVLEVITGSRGYGLNTTASDTDIRGVFVLPKDMFYSMEYTAQVSNETSDIVYYEFGRFIELLAKNNPNIMELLNTPEDCILKRDKLFDRLKQEMFLSKLCEKSFANYAYTQVKKAYGLEKKILNPMDKERKSILDFCFVYEEGDSVPLNQFLDTRKWTQEMIGLTSVPHLRDCYNMYYSDEIKYPGVIRGDDSNDVCMSSIPKGEEVVGMLYFNKDGYSVYCKKYREYWEWVDKRNDERYKTTMSHGKNYDSKNMMHVFRLLKMAKEIATEKNINVFREDREFLLSIKRGEFEYNELLQMAESLKCELPLLYGNSGLPEAPDEAFINELLIEFRKEFYG